MSQTSEPLVSIVIPCYNAQRWVGAAIESALRQTYRRIEVIVVDDGSSDRSLDIIKQFAPGITWVSTANRGPSAARNAGLRIAKGEWIQFLDADDLLHPEKVRLSLAAWQNHQLCEFVWARKIEVEQGFSLTRDADVPGADVLNPQVTLSRDALPPYHVATAAMLGRALIDRVGDWNESIKGWEDVEYQARIAARFPLHARMEIPLYFYRQHDGERVGRSERTPANIRGELRCLNATRTVLEGSKFAPSVWKSYLLPMYLQLALSAAAAGDKQTFFDLMQVSADLRGTLKFRLKCWIAIAFTQLAGVGLICAIFRRLLPPRSISHHGATPSRACY
jgi:glycosyltransferase involved in cell wall biosynthesis